MFVSYARENAAQVSALVQSLRGMGYRVFFDVETIRVGDAWKTRLHQSIRDARALLLCWSTDAARSEFVRAEYSKAEGVGKRILPWLLDDTPLPAMLEIQGIAVREPEAAASRLASELRWTLTRRRWFAGVLATLFCGGGIAMLRMYPVSSFEFAGQVTDDRNVPLPGVLVTTQGRSTLTDAVGNFRLTIEGPKPDFVRVRFQRDGYREEGANASTDGLFHFAMSRESR